MSSISSWFNQRRAAIRCVAIALVTMAATFCQIAHTADDGFLDPEKAFVLRAEVIGAEHIIRIPVASPLFQPVLATVPLQVFAYEIAVARGTDVDQPRNLAKSVTVE